MADRLSAPGLLVVFAAYRAMRATLDGSFVSGIGAANPTESPSAADRSASSQTIEALKAANSKPGSLPSGMKKNSPDSSRDAAAEALKKFFDKR